MTCSKLAKQLLWFLIYDLSIASKMTILIKTCSKSAKPIMTLSKSTMFFDF